MGNWRTCVDIWVHVKHGLTWTFQGLYRLFQQECLQLDNMLVPLSEPESPTAQPAELSHPEIIQFIKTIVFQNLHSLNVAEKKNLYSCVCLT